MRNFDNKWGAENYPVLYYLFGRSLTCNLGIVIWCFHWERNTKRHHVSVKKWWKNRFYYAIIRELENLPGSNEYSHDKFGNSNGTSDWSLRNRNERFHPSIFYSNFLESGYAPFWWVWTISMDFQNQVVLWQPPYSRGPKASIGFFFHGKSNPRLVPVDVWQ